MKMPKNVDLSKSINREKVIEPSIANNEKNIECPPLPFGLIRTPDFFAHRIKKEFHRILVFVAKSEEK